MAGVDKYFTFYIVYFTFLSDFEEGFLEIRFGGVLVIGAANTFGKESVAGKEDVLCEIATVRVRISQ